MIYTEIQHYSSPLSQEEFETMKKCLPLSMRKVVTKRHNELKRIKQKKEELKEYKFLRMLDQDTFFRFFDIPFVIAKLAWDYADSIILMASQMGIDKVGELSRTIRELKREYDRYRSSYTDDAHRKSEEENMYVFEDGVRDLFNLYLVNIECDIKSEYPNLDHEYVIYLKAIYQCHIVLQSIFCYAGIMTKKIEKIVGHKIDDIIPTHLYTLDNLVLEYVGDNPISEDLKKQQSMYAQSLANRMTRIELNET